MFRKIVKTTLAALSLILVLPAYGANDVCVEFKDRTIAVLRTKDASWNGEHFSVRYFKSSSEKEGVLRLVYWTRDGSRRVAYDGGFADFIVPDGWATYSIDLPEQPLRYQLERAGSYCVKTRPKTFLERLEDAL
jgi:hypothetical protein